MYEFIKFLFYRLLNNNIMKNLNIIFLTLMLFIANSQNDFSSFSSFSKPSSNMADIKTFGRSSLTGSNDNPSVLQTSNPNNGNPTFGAAAISTGGQITPQYTISEKIQSAS